MIGGARHRIGHAAETQLVEARQELLVVLVAEDAKHPLGGIGSAAARDERQDQAGEIGVIEARRSLHGAGVSDLRDFARVSHGGGPTTA